jgi:hypothetical protein
LRLCMFYCSKDINLYEVLFSPFIWMRIYRLLKFIISF